jgi:hypothetical protein
MFFGGDERIRTADLPRAKRSLCQLSYTPVLFTLGTANIALLKYNYRFTYDYQYFICNKNAILPIAHAWLYF